MKAKPQTKPLHQILSVMLRSGSLAAKLGLTLYMGRYLSLADIGAYGLVFGAVSILSNVLGIRFDYVVSRDLVGIAPSDVLGKMRDQAAFLFLNHAFFACVMVLLAVTNIADIPHSILFYIYILSVVENMATAIHVNMTSLGKPVIANALYFIRAASWAFPVMIWGLVDASMRRVDFIFQWWIAGVLASIVVALWLWRAMPWGETKQKPIHWVWVKEGVKKSFFIWLGTVGLALGMYVDRFVVMKYLGIDAVGIATFYLSFILAILTLVQSGVLSFAYPTLIRMHREKDHEGFRREVRMAGLQAALFAAAVALAVGVAVPLMGRIFGKPEIVKESLTLWLLLAGTWIRANAETLYWVLFARNLDKPIWLGNLLFLVPSFGCSALFVPIFGMPGIGYGAIVSALFLLVWRAWHVAK